MSKRKFQELVKNGDDDVIVDEPPAPSTSNNEEHPDKNSDVVQGRCKCQCTHALSKPAQKKAKHVSLDQGHKNKSDRKTGTIDQFERRDQVDATPPSTANEEYHQHQDHQRIQSGITALMPVIKIAERYNMSHPNRGTCMVFNHEVFEGDLDNREGSSADVERIEATFTKLGFDIITHDNLKYYEVMKQIQTLSEPENHVNNDCVCVFVLTHGMTNDYLWANDRPYKSNSLWKNFTADKCPTLAGKPKLFFYQACRGEKLDGGCTLVPRSPGYTEADSPVASYTIPTHCDFLIAHSCTEGFFSWRNPKEGSWYIQCLCDVLDKFADSTDLLKMLTMTARIVATDFQSLNDLNPEMDSQKQVPSSTSTLTRELYFTSK